MKRLEALRAHKAAGEHPAVVRMAHEILLHPQTLRPRELNEVAWAGGTASMAMGDIKQTVAFTRKERRYAKATRDAELILISAFHHGTAILHLGDHGEAIKALQEFADGAGILPKLARYTGGAYFNLGVAFLQTKNYATASQWLMRSRDACAELRDHQGEARALLEIAWVDLVTGRAEPAGYRLSQAELLLRTFPDTHLDSVRIVHQAYYHFCCKEYQEALDLCRAIFEPAHPGAKPHQRSEAAWIAGECGLKLGHVEQARQMAALAAVEAIKANWTALMNKAGELKKRCRDARDGPTQGAS